MTASHYKKRSQLAAESAERCVPAGVPDRAVRIGYYIQGYMAGAAAVVRYAGKRARAKPIATMTPAAVAYHADADGDLEGYDGA